MATQKCQRSTCHHLHMAVLTLISSIIHPYGQQINEIFKTFMFEHLKHDLCVLSVIRDLMNTLPLQNDSTIYCLPNFIAV